jgi:hypothetical protein
MSDSSVPITPTLWMFTITVVLLIAGLVWHRLVTCHPDAVVRSKRGAAWLADLADADALTHHARTRVASSHYDLLFLLPTVQHRLRPHPLAISRPTTGPGALVLHSPRGDTVTLSDLPGFDAVRAAGLAAHHRPVARLRRLRLRADELHLLLDVDGLSYRLRARAVEIRLGR